MRNILKIIVLFFCLPANLHAGNTNVNKSLLNKLAGVNNQWLFRPESAVMLPDMDLSGEKSSTQWIALHLRLVENALRKSDISGLSSEQQHNRACLLDKLNAYWHTGSFPINDYFSYQTPVFIDRHGTHCAVGYLMQQSGADGLAQQINSTEKFAYVKEIKTPGVKEWADNNGFTLDELAWIQPGYPPTTEFSPVGLGANGPVKILSPNPYYNATSLVIAGSFDTLGGLPCLNIGYYSDTNLACLGQGIAGVINGVYCYSGKVYVGGNFPHGDSSYPFAVYDTAWHYMAIPGHPNGLITAVTSGSSDYILEVAITDSALQGVEEILYLSNSMTWGRRATVVGTVFNMAYSNFGRIYTGAFDSVWVPLDSTQDALKIGHNVIFWEDWANSYNWFGIDSAVSDTVLSTLVYGNAIYFGGVGNSSTGHNNICLTKYLNGTLQPLVFSSFFYGSNINAIRTLGLYNQSQIIFGGDFNIVPQGIGDFAQDLALYDLDQDYVIPLGIFDSTVNSVAELGNTWYLAGDFVNGSGPGALLHLAQIDNPTAIIPVTGNRDFNIYPNPTGNIIIITGLQPNTPVIVTNLLGQTLISTFAAGDKQTLDVSHLASGMYFVNNMKLVKE